jgi:hypothetical protein
MNSSVLFLLLYCSWAADIVKDYEKSFVEISKILLDCDQFDLLPQNDVTQKHKRNVRAYPKQDKIQLLISESASESECLCIIIIVINVLIVYIKIFVL